MTRKRPLARSWRGAAIAGFLAAAAVLAPSPASAVFYLYVVDDDGQINVIRNPGAQSGNLTCTGASACSQLRATVGSPDDGNPNASDIGFDSSGQLWGASPGYGGNNSARVFRFNLTTGAYIAASDPGNLGAPFGDGGLNPNALAFNGSTMYIGSNSNAAANREAYTVSGTTVTTVPSGGGDNVFGTSFTPTSLTPGAFTSAEVSTEGDYAFAGSTMYATLRVADASGPGNDAQYNGTFLATIDTGTGAATMIGRTMSGNTNVQIEGLAWDSSSNTLWGVNGNTVYTVAVATGIVTAKFTMSTVSSLQGAAGIVPEPGTLALLGSGLAGLWAVRRRRRA